MFLLVTIVCGDSILKFSLIHLNAIIKTKYYEVLSVYGKLLFKIDNLKIAQERAAILRGGIVSAIKMGRKCKSKCLTF